jgi:hypothetical protein
MRETEFGLSAKFKVFKDFSLDRRSTSFEGSSSSFNLAVLRLKVFLQIAQLNSSTFVLNLLRNSIRIITKKVEIQIKKV